MNVAQWRQIITFQCGKTFVIYIWLVFEFNFLAQPKACSKPGLSLPGKPSLWWTSGILIVLILPFVPLIPLSAPHQHLRQIWSKEIFWVAMILPVSLTTLVSKMSSTNEESTQPLATAIKTKSAKFKKIFFKWTYLQNRKKFKENEFKVAGERDS